ncbi:MAG: hypothetical protein U1E65_29525 [Myxococcota bacterium]
MGKWWALWPCLLAGCGTAAPIELSWPELSGAASAILFLRQEQALLDGVKIAVVDLRSGEGASCLAGPFQLPHATLTALVYPGPPHDLCFEPGCAALGEAAQRLLPESPRVLEQQIDPAVPPSGFVDSTLAPPIRGLSLAPSCRSPRRAPAQIALGAIYSMARLEDGSLYSWGGNDVGQLGLGDGKDHALPERVELPPVRSLGVGERSVCAVIEPSGALSCWGDAGPAILRPVSTDPVARPQTVVGTGGYDQVAIGWEFGCGTRAGALFCWGNFLPEHVQAPLMTPTRTGTLTDVIKVAAGKNHGCLLRAGDDRLYCFGTAASGCLGLGPNGLDAPIPTPVPGISGVVDVALGTWHSCALTRDHRVYCWGYNMHNSVSATDPSDELDTPLEVMEMRGATAISAAGYSSCALLEHQVYCWGMRAGGAPSPFGSVTGSAAISLGSGIIPSGSQYGDNFGDPTVCSIDADRSIVCGGGNLRGQVGIGVEERLSEGTRPYW